MGLSLVGPQGSEFVHKFPSFGEGMGPLLVFKLSAVTHSRCDTILVFQRLHTSAAKVILLTVPVRYKCYDCSCFNIDSVRTNLDSAQSGRVWRLQSDIAAVAKSGGRYLPSVSSVEKSHGNGEGRRDQSHLEGNIFFSPRDTKDTAWKAGERQPETVWEPLGYNILPNPCHDGSDFTDFVALH